MVKAGPEALSAIYRCQDLRRSVRAAAPSVPLYPDLERATVDSWSMTSLFSHTGRPRIGPWLHGWQERAPRTSVLWRHYLPVIMQDTDRGRRFSPPYGYHVETFFEAARSLQAETLWADSADVLAWLLSRVAAVAGATAEPEPVHDDLYPLKRPDAPVAVVLSQSGSFREMLVHRDLINLSRASRAAQDNFSRRLWGRRLVVDARLGGLAAGHLDIKADTAVSTPEDNWGLGNEASGDLPASPYRIRVSTGADRGAIVEDGVVWQEIDAFVWRLDEDEMPLRWLSVQARDGAESGERHRATSLKAETLQDHVREVCGQAAHIADALDLQAADRAMLVTAARHHDDGKAVRRWQRAYGVPSDWAANPYAKSAKRLKRSMLSRYRHEFVSTVLAARNGLDLARDDPRFELALHLIASHHGQARPVIGIKGADDLPPRHAATEGLAIAQRYARQQRIWGPWGLAWWESLLRSANYRASRAQFQAAIEEAYR